MREDAIAGFEINGHSGAGEKGHDIVCAAISSAAYMAANTITEVIGAKAQISTADGAMKLLLASGAEEECRVTLEGFMLHIKQLRKQRPKNIKIITVNTGRVSLMPS